MCTTDIYPYVDADGNHGETRETRRCTSYRRRESCDPIVYRHPRRSAAIPIPAPRAPHAHLPPSPRLTPGSSFPSPHMHRGFSPRRPATPLESDSEGGSQRRRRPSIYVNGQRVVTTPGEPPASPLGRRHGSYETGPRAYDAAGRRDGEARGGRVVIVEGPPTPRSPPVNYAVPRTAPASPSPSSRIPAESLRHRPVIVDEREQPAGRRTVRIEVPPSPVASESSSSGSRHRRARREQQQWQYADEGGERGRDEAEEEARRRRTEARIAEANRKIAERAERPVPSRRAATTYVRPTVEVQTPVGLGVSGEQLVEGMRGLGMQEREEDEGEEEEEEARRQRLRERMLPRRRASIGPGSRRVRVEYGDGMYRLE